MARSVSSTPDSSATTTTDLTASLQLGVTGQTDTDTTAWSTPGLTSIQTILEDSSCEMDAGERLIFSAFCNISGFYFTDGRRNQKEMSFYGFEVLEIKI